MKTFTLVIQDPTQVTQFDNVMSFVGEDASGSFGIRAGHARFMTALQLGLSRFKQDEQASDSRWLYLGTSSALLDFRENQLTISTQHFLVDSDYQTISRSLQEIMRKEAEQLTEQKQSFRHIEEEVLKRVWELNRNKAD
ncbi:hypothetical protein THMIRHAM_18800 [Thiomicrorhabdus immobilis]|uniref:ATP synthase F1 complex delta/epsilon subunit N-terminal domain-containing protein n=1 Tax=Thiomicrorhabdus immobilis TaxID=2791037 RepID=A0ABM7MF72_9GAMM|nr:hypothetical protein [Thiomicrorhabdus immobilis]BCN94095.1 hypothetical protein THMIRHAM_18800 [Thiomicrorhabdus immobilis]